MKNIHDVLEKVRQSTQIDAWKIELTSGNTGLYSSKIGGIPYWDIALDYPKDIDGRALCLLAQINLSDLGDNELFAPSGLLQFFIGTDELMGMDFDEYDSGHGSRIVFHETIKDTSIDEILALNIPLTSDRDIISPVWGEHAITLTRHKVSMSPMDYRFDGLARLAADELGADISKGLQALIGDDEFFELCSLNSGHWLTGYPYFTQEDPRYIEEYSCYDRMLLQLDSEGEKIMWGDAGVGAFFLTEEAMNTRDYSKFLYNWDCA